jgi:hypothetical protein
VCLQARRRLGTFVRAQKFEMKHAFKLPGVGERFGTLLNTNQKTVYSRYDVIPHFSFCSYLKRIGKRRFVCPQYVW